MVWFGCAIEIIKYCKSSRMLPKYKNSSKPNQYSHCLGYSLEVGLLLYVLCQNIFKLGKNNLHKKIGVLFLNILEKLQLEM